MKGGDDYYVTDPIVPVSSEVRTLSQTSGFMIANDSLTFLISNSFCVISRLKEIFFVWEYRKVTI